MIDYKFLFDGVGGVVAVPLGGWLWRSLRRPRTASASVPAARLVGSGVSAVTFADIQRALNEAPPLHRDEVAQRYKGLLIQWETTYQFASLGKNDRVELVLRIKYEVLGHILCEVRRSEYPQLSILLKDAPITALGRIAKVDFNQVRLDEVALFFSHA